MQNVSALTLIALVSLCPLMSRAAQLTVGERLPELRGEFLTGRPAVLPQAVEGKLALVLLGFTYDSRFAVEAWAKRFRRDFGSEPRVTVLEVPVIGGMARMGRWFIDRRMRSGTPKEDYEHVVTVYGSADEWKRRVGFRDPKACYSVLLDASGKVVWSGAGGFDEAIYQRLAAEVRKRLD